MRRTEYHAIMYSPSLRPPLSRKGLNSFPSGPTDLHSRGTGQDWDWHAVFLLQPDADGRSSGALLHATLGANSPFSEQKR